MNFKKYLMFLVVAALAIVLVACGGADNEKHTEDADKQTDDTA